MHIVLQILLPDVTSSLLQVGSSPPRTRKWRSLESYMWRMLLGILMPIRPPLTPCPLPLLMRPVLRIRSPFSKATTALFELRPPPSPLSRVTILWSDLAHVWPPPGPRLPGSSTGVLSYAQRHVLWGECRPEQYWHHLFWCGKWIRGLLDSFELQRQQQ